MINCILAKSENNVIGNNNSLPWNLPDDLQWFKECTLNKTVVMGRKTFESIGKPLPKRKNCILTKSSKSINGCYVYDDIDRFVDDHIHDDVWVIGGQSVYEEFFKICDVVYLTLVYGKYEGDAFAPKFPKRLQLSQMIKMTKYFEIQKWETK